jgi:D-cysteine desulfhydrase
MSIPYPARIPLAQTPTPLERLDRLGARVGVEFYCKRDDLTGAALSGNKVRKLEFLLAEARAKGASTVITCGGAQSNHCRATAIAAARLGMRSLLLLRVPDPSQPPPLEANILLDRLVGAEIRWVSREEYAGRASLMRQIADQIGRAYVIPEGGSNATGAWGYVRAVEELAGQLPRGPVTIVYAAGSGGTGAGLLLGCRLAGLPEARVVGINVCDDRDYFVRVISEIVRDACDRYRLDAGVAPAEIEIIDGYVGRGYALSRPEELKLLVDVARTEGIVLDPVYTGKAMFGLLAELYGCPGSLGERVVFVHTGGIFGLFPKAADLAPLL